MKNELFTVVVFGWIRPWSACWALMRELTWEEQAPRIEPCRLWLQYAFRLGCSYSQLLLGYCYCSPMAHPSIESHDFEAADTLGKEGSCSPVHSFLDFAPAQFCKWLALTLCSGLNLGALTSSLQTPSAWAVSYSSHRPSAVLPQQSILCWFERPHSFAADPRWAYPIAWSVFCSTRMSPVNHQPCPPVYLWRWKQSSMKNSYNANEWMNLHWARRCLRLG